MSLKKFRKKIKSSLFYEIIRNYFVKSIPSYSESFGEDIFIDLFFKDLSKGFYLDIGCNLPKKGSLSYKLYKRNWKGIKIDISERSIKLNNFHRKRDVNLNLSVGKKNCFVDSFIFYDNCSMNTVDQDFSKYTEKSVNKKPEIKKIKQLTLDKILSIYNIRKFNFLNIDVEGNEMNVLEGFQIRKFQPDLVSIEIHDDECPPKNNRIYKYFIKNKYSLISIYGWTYFFSPDKNKNIHFNFKTK